MPTHETNVSTDARRQIGVVAIGRNEGERLRSCLDQARRVTDRVVYVDSASSDGSASLAEALGVTVRELTPDAPYTAARGRREGLACLMSLAPDLRYVQFVDGDCILQPHWIESASTFLDRHPDVAVVCGRRFEARPDASFYNQMIDREWDTPVGEAAACGGDSLMRIEAVMAVGSYRPDLLAGEEPELCARLRAAGWRIWRIDQLMSEHDAAIDKFGMWWKRAKRGGAGYAQVWSVTRKNRSPLYGRQIISAVFWAAIIPLVAILLAIMGQHLSLLLLAPALWFIQTLRIAARIGSQPLSFRLKIAAVTMVTKVAELLGALGYFITGGRGQSTTYRPAPAGAVAEASQRQPPCA